MPVGALSVWPMPRLSVSGWLAGFLVLLAILPCPAHGATGQALDPASAALRLEPGVPARQTAAFTAHRFESAGREPLAAARTGSFRPVDRREADFGFRTGGIWLRLPLENGTGIPQARVLLIGTNFMTEIDAWLVTAGGDVPVLSQSTRHPFGTRPIAYHQLAAPLDVPPGRSTLYVRYRSEGASTLPIALETGTSFVAVSTRAVAIDFSFHAVVLLGAIAGLGAAALFPRRVFLAYGLHALAILLFVAQREGYAFQYLWPNRPVWNDFSSLPIGSALVLTGAFFTRSYLDTRTLAPRADLLLRAIAWSQLLLVLSAVVVEVRLLKQLAILSVSAAALLFLGLGILALVRRGRRYTFYVLGWLGFVGATLATTGASFLGVALTRAETLDIVRAAMVFDSFMMGMAVLTGVLAIRHDRDRAREARLAALDQNIQLMRRMDRLERNADIARTLAQANARLVADTSHDLRQPIHALKASMADLTADTSSARRDTVERALAHIEALVETMLAQASEPEASAGPEEPRVEVLDSGLIIATLAALHGPDAEARGIPFRTVNACNRILAEPLALVRILGNLLGNAFAHGGGRPVLLGTRRRGDRLQFEVHDQGPGMCAETLDQVRARGVRGETADAAAPEGHGLGLSIVAELAEAHGFDWSIDSHSGRGTVARVSVPLADAN